jgi:tryptophan-rich sensory protein
MNTKILFVLCILSIVIPMYINLSCSYEDTLFVSKIKPSHWVFTTIWAILYVFMATSMYLLATTKLKTSQHWIKFALLITLMGYILNYFYMYTIGCQKNWTTGLYILIAYIILLPLQIFLTFYCNSLSGILLTPLSGWVIYTLLLNTIHVYHKLK